MQCGAKTRSGGPCKSRAMPNGRCRMHGGKAGRPITHGRYSKISRPRIAELLAEQEQDPDPLNILPEIRLLRALIQDYIERYDKMTSALLAWHASFGQETETAKKPRQVPDILAVGKFISDIGRLAQTMHRRQQEGSISLATLDRVVEQLGVEVAMALQETLPDEALRTQVLESIERRWGTIRLEPRAGGHPRAEADASEADAALSE